MAFHLGFELPASSCSRLDADSEKLTPFEVEIILKQIRKNARVIDTYIERLDLFLSREKVPPKEAYLQKIRARMLLLMEENDNFRRLLCRHWQCES